MDKLACINRALPATGNNTITALNDGSPEAVASETAFERAVDYLMSEHQWPFATDNAVLVRTGASDFAPYTDRFALPAGCWHLRTVRDSQYGNIVDYVLHKNEIHTVLDSGIYGVFVKRPTLDSTWHAQAGEILTSMVEVWLLRSLNEDYKEADSREATTALKLRRGAARTDQQSPARNAYRSNVVKARMTRRV